MQTAHGSSGRRCIFLVEDNYKDLVLMRYVLEETGLIGCVFAARSGKEAIAYLSNKSRQEEFGAPGVMFLDINLPGMSGLRLLEWVRADALLRDLPVVIFTDSEDKKDHEKAYFLGATSLKVKPMDFSEFTSAFREMVEYWCKELNLRPERRGTNLPGATAS